MNSLLANTIRILNAALAIIFVVVGTVAGVLGGIQMGADWIAFGLVLGVLAGFVAAVLICGILALFIEMRSELIKIRMSLAKPNEGV